jgi:hypothetical protein
MPYLVIGIVVLMAFALWIVGRLREDDPALAELLFAYRLRDGRRSDAPGGPEDDDARWNWPAG